MEEININYPEESEIEAGFTIDNDGLADWAVEKVKSEEARKDRYIEACNQRIEMMQAQKEQEKSRCLSRTESLRSALNHYFENTETRSTKTQRVLDLPSGKLVLKFPSQSYEKDEKALLEELKESEYVEMVPKLKWADLKKDLDIVDGVVVRKSTGEFIEGISIIEKPAVFEIK